MWSAWSQANDLYTDQSPMTEKSPGLIRVRSNWLGQRHADIDTGVITIRLGQNIPGTYAWICQGRGGQVLL